MLKESPWTTQAKMAHHRVQASMARHSRGENAQSRSEVVEPQMESRSPHLTLHNPGDAGIDISSAKSLLTSPYWDLNHV